MNTKEYVKSLFKDYEETADLRDFMEELEANLDSRIASLIKKGAGEAEAFDKASNELGDISALADEISLKKRQEVFEEQYLDIRRYMKGPRVASYVAAGIVFLFGVLTAFIVYFGVHAGEEAAIAPGGPGGMRGVDLAGVFGSFLPFFTAAAAAFTYLGLTQETASLNPMKKKRAALYSLGAALIAFGAALFPLVFFGAGDKEGPVSAVATLLPFVLPGAGLLAFLILTEKDRRKSWAIAHYTEEVKRYGEIWQNPAQALRFGLFSGAIWIFAFGVFFLLGFTIGFMFSWLAFVFAIAFQLLVQGIMSKK
jgi:MFS family permease